ncbi:hypothetical protein ACOBV9_21995 (plasmid) [Pseudoalteromonas espejiana]
MLGNISSASFYAAFGSKQALYSECLALYTSTCGETFFRLETSLFRQKQRLKIWCLKPFICKPQLNNLGL